MHLSVRRSLLPTGYLGYYPDSGLRTISDPDSVQVRSQQKKIKNPKVVATSETTYS